MNNTVWKTILSFDELQTIEVPAGARMLTAHEQNDFPCLWYLCDPEAKTEKRQIIVVGTGWSRITTGVYIDSVFLHSGLVFHVFDGGTQ